MPARPVKDRMAEGLGAGIEEVVSFSRIAISTKIAKKKKSFSFMRRSRGAPGRPQEFG